MQQYTFIVRAPTTNARKHRVHIKATRYRNALNKVLMKYPNKFVKTKFAKNMVLIEARAAAAKESKTQKKPIYVIIDNDGECDISSAPLRGVAHKFVNGIEDKSYDYKAPAVPEEKSKLTIPAQSEKAQKIISKQNVKTEKVMATKKSPAKKAVKKIAAKKVNGKKVTRGNNMALSLAEWVKVDKLRGEKSFSAFSRDLVLAKIK